MLEVQKLYPASRERHIEIRKKIISEQDLATAVGSMLKTRLGKRVVVCIARTSLFKF